MNLLKSELTTEYIVLVARVVLGSVFLVAAVDKAADPDTFATSIDAYRLLPHAVSLTIATLLPWLELLCALALLSGFAVRGSALLIFFMLTLFTVAVISAIVRGLDISCGCFTQDPTANKIGWVKVGENLGMIALSCLLLFLRGKTFSLEHFYRKV